VSDLPKKPATLDFGHPPETIQFWQRLVREALSLSTPTPFYIFSALPVAERISELDAALAAAGFQFKIKNSKLKIHHWLSCKTQPVAPLLRWWHEQGRGIEVVSEFELRAALAEGCLPENILVNGPAKHHWLPRFDLRELSVNLDSRAELDALLPRAQKCNWRLGIRILTGEEFDPEHPQFPTQFGFASDEAVAALEKLLRAKARIETVQFHLRTNIPSAQIYVRAIAEVAKICRAAKFAPQFLDLGGGVPVRHVLSRGGKVYDGEFGLRSFAKMLRQSAKLFSGLREIWLENGRFVSAGSGALVVKILDVKERRGLRQLICDGGRTLHALVSNWEQHELISLPRRSGPCALTAVYGPTCMAFDRLACRPLPRSLRAGDRLLWLDAGAYHLPWETRFSHDLAAVLWHDGRKINVVRERGDFERWRRQWRWSGLEAIPSS
jgi:diaminopimelate decarboxylase